MGVPGEGACVGVATCTLPDLSSGTKDALISACRLGSIIRKSESMVVVAGLNGYILIPLSL